MRAWVSLRSSSAVYQGMLEDLDIMQQPSGFIDNVLFKWRTEAQMEVYPQAVHLRDLFASALSQESRQIMVLAHQVPDWLGGKMTAALQVTDTDGSRPLKIAANKAKGALRRAAPDGCCCCCRRCCYRCCCCCLLLLPPMLLLLLLMRHIRPSVTKMILRSSC